MEYLEDRREGMIVGGPDLCPPADSVDVGAVSESSVVKTSSLSSVSPKRPGSGTGGLQNSPDPSDKSLPVGLAGDARLLILRLCTPGLRGGTGPKARGDTGGGPTSACERGEGTPLAKGWELGKVFTGRMIFVGTGFRCVHEDRFDIMEVLLGDGPAWEVLDMEEMSVGTGLAGEEAVEELSSRSVLVDGWAVCCDK